MNLNPKEHTYICLQPYNHGKSSYKCYFSVKNLSTKLMSTFGNKKVVYRQFLNTFYKALKIMLVMEKQISFYL